MKRAILFGAVIAAVGCKSGKVEQADPQPPATAAMKAPAELDLDFALLVDEVQLLRDREFRERPRFRAQPDYIAPPSCVDACRNERELLTEVFLGAAPKPTRLAHYDRGSGEVVYAESADPRELEVAIIVALVEALDRQTGAPLAPATTWDAHLARQAVHRGPGVFVAALREGRRRQKNLDAAQLGAHPEVLAELVPESVVAEFAQREGFALTAAMFRSGGWSAVELLRNEPPTTTAAVVRPDRYLQGADYGAWQFPTALDESRTGAGMNLAESGRLGPASFVMWLSRYIDPRVARAAYLGLESDHYRVWRTDGAWTWEWVSLWNTPSTAQQVVEALDAGLRVQAPDGRYSVLRKGNTVAVIGASKPLGATAMELGAKLVEARPTFQPGTKKGLSFVPTPADRLHTRALEATLEEGIWSDPVTGITIDLSSLTAWKIQKTDETSVRWFAKHADGSLLELTTEVASPLRPPFADAAYAADLGEAFRKTVTLQGELSSERSTLPTPSTIHLGFTGQTDAGENRRFEVWHFPAGDYLVTLSLQCDPSAFDARLAEVRPVLGTVEMMRSEAEDRSGGIIEFRVEDE